MTYFEGSRVSSLEAKMERLEKSVDQHRKSQHIQRWTIVVIVATQIMHGLWHWVRP